MLKEKIKALMVKNEEKGNSKKTIENMVVFVIILIITILAINVIWKGDKKNKGQAQTQDSNKKLATESSENISQNNEESTIQQDLEQILSNVVGVGKVKVLLTYSQTSQTIPLYNEDSRLSNTEESDKQGGNRKISESDTKKEVIFQEVNGENIPVVQSIVKPKIEGAIITAEGASDLKVKEYIIQAVEAATGLATHKIQVFEMQKSASNG